jgi:hypothetical protein
VDLEIDFRTGSSLRRHCTTRAPSAPALLLGFALPTESELVTATGLLASALC